MNIVDLDEDEEWFEWIIEEICGMQYDDYLFNHLSLTCEILEPHLDKIINGIELYSNADIGYQMLGILILETGSTFPYNVKKEILKSTTLDYDRKWEWYSGGEKLREFYLNDFREKILAYTPGTRTYLQDLKIGFDSQFKKTCIGLEMYNNIVRSGNIDSFDYVNLDFCELNEIPRTLFDLNHLESLSIEHNYLTEVSEDIGKLVNLEYLWLDFNQLKALPRSVSELKCLKGLSIAYNSLETVQDFLKREGVILNISNNPFERNL
ncbi:MAG: leucine-rich repeat domain-containing protein [Promethearchaeota archaeon]|jgi:hypothetical protein